MFRFAIRSPARDLARLALLCATLLCASQAFAWGGRGHRLVGHLAEDQLSPQALAEVRRLLRNEPDPTLAGISDWADELRDGDPELGRRSAPWHYVNIGEDNCRFDGARECADGNCLVGALHLQVARLADRRLSDAERTEALKFVVHFVADAHQPLHAGYARDRGGNDFPVRGAGGDDLHWVWDTGVVEALPGGAKAELKHLRAMPVPPAAAVVDLSPEHWVEASCRFVLRPGFYPPDGRIDRDYYRRWQPQVEMQLRLAGWRLAGILEAALAPQPRRR